MIGLDISDQSIKVVQLAHRKDYRVLAHCWRAIPVGIIDKGVVRDIAVLQRIVRESLSSCRVASTTADPVVVSIPEVQSFVRVIEVPVMSADELSEAVQWEVAQHIPFGLENVYIDWQSLPGGHKPTSGRQEVLVGAAQKRVVDPLVQVFQGLELDVAAFELESQAIVRALISSELKRRQGLLVVDIGGTSTNVIVHDHGAMRFTATLQRGVRNLLAVLPEPELYHQRLGRPPGPSLSAHDTEKIARLLAPGETELVVEVRGVIEFYNSIDARHEVKEILLTGGGANLPGLDTVWLRHFADVHIQRGNPWVNVLSYARSKRPPLSMHESVHFTTAIGLSLRRVDV